MTSPASIVPCRGDYFATDGATAALNSAIKLRCWAAREWSTDLKKVLRVEMRYYARIAVVHARRYRACRST